MSLPSPLRVAHSTRAEHAFFCAGLALGKPDSSPEQLHVTALDSEALADAGMRGELDVLTLSLHAAALVGDQYALLGPGSFFPERHGPVLFGRGFSGNLYARDGADARAWLAGKRIGVPGARSSAALLLQLFACGANAQQPNPSTGDTISGRDQEFARVEFETVALSASALPASALEAALSAKNIDGLVCELASDFAPVGAVSRIAELGVWWNDFTGLPVPDSAVAIHKRLGTERSARVAQFVRGAVQWAQQNEMEALQYATRCQTELTAEQVHFRISRCSRGLGVEGDAVRQAAARRFWSEARRLGLIRVPIRSTWTN